jgi:septal ring factor EnvC (AmiA/AmiB activator)
MGRPGTRTNPIVTVSEAGKFSGLGQEAEDAAKTAEGDVATAAGTAERGVASGALAEGASGVAATAAEGAGVAEGGLGLLAGGAAEGGIATALAAALPVILPAAGIAAAIGGAVFAGIKLFGDNSKPRATTGGTDARSGTREFGTGQTQAQLTAEGKTELNQAASLMKPTEGAVVWGPGGQSSRQQIAPSAENVTKANALYKTWGGQLERQLQAGWQQYAHQDSDTMFDQWMGAFKDQKPKVQAAGAEAAIAYADGLERNGKLPSGAAQHMLDAIEERFPFLKKIIGTNARELAVSVDTMVGGMKNSIHKLISGPNSFADIGPIVGNASLTTTEKWGVALNQLKTDTGSSLAGTRRAANSALRGMVSDFVRDLPAIPQAMREQGAIGRNALVANIRSAIDVVKTQMSTGVVNIKTGTKELDALNKSLNQANKVIQTQADSLTNIQRAAQSITEAKTYQLTHRAGGGSLPGSEFGYGDNMTLVDPLGRPRARMAGDESVYTRHQRPWVDAGLQAIGFQGGSHELWSRVNRPHGYAQGGSLPGRVISGSIGTPSQKLKAPPKRRAPVTIQSALKASRGLTGIDREVGQLDTKYQNQEQLFSLYDGSPLPVNDLTVLMKIREKQWDLLFGEWKQLPADLRNLNRMTYGTPVAGSPATGPHAHRTGGVVQSVSQLQKNVNATAAQITSVQNDAANITSQAAQTSAQAGATASNVANANAAALAKTTDQLNAIHSQSLSDTTQIGNLTQQLNSASGDNYARIQQKISTLKNQRATDQTAAQGLSTQLGNQRRANTSAAAQLRQQRYDVAYAQAAERAQLKQKTAALQATLKKLNQELSREQKLEQDAKQAIGDVRTRLYGDSSGSGSVQDALVTYGYDMLDLNQQGAPIHRRYVKQMQEIFKKAGLQLPSGWASGKANEFNSPAAVAAQQLQAFQAGLYNVLTQFGSNFVAAGANPIGNAGQLMAGVANYGAAAGATPAHSRGGPLRGEDGTPYGGMSFTESGGVAGDTHINITQHFAGPPPDAHSYSNGLKWEIGNAI